MKNIGKFLYSLTSICLILTSGCQKEDVPELNSRVLFSVDLGQAVPYFETYMAAYTSDGKLINYGSLSDSSKWELKGQCRENKIDVLYFELANETQVIIDHFRNVPIGQSFGDPNSIENQFSPYFLVTLKVEDFGNDIENSTSSTIFESIIHDFERGSNNVQSYFWNKKENGYAFKHSIIDSDPKCQGHELIVFERGTNVPWVHYMDIPATDLASGDTITLNKSDFTPGEVRTVQVNSSTNEFDNIFLYTYNSVDGKEDIITSFDQVCTDQEKLAKYVVSDILPINHWKLNYFASSSGTTSYTLRSNKEIPSSIEIKDLTGYKIASYENQFLFTHSPVFSDKSIVRSQLSFSKNDCNTFVYNVHFDAGETLGSTLITLVEIPHEILSNYYSYEEVDTLDWNPYRYSQTYTNLPGNSPLAYLKNTVLYRNSDITSTSDYTYENYSVYLKDQFHEIVGSKTAYDKNIR